MRVTLLRWAKVEKEASLKVVKKSDPSKSSTSGGHRAGFDAFMTGYRYVRYSGTKVNFRLASVLSSGSKYVGNKNGDHNFS